MPAAIASFTDEWAALSNFHQGRPILLGRYAYPTGEHMFQAYKTTRRDDHLKIIASATPAEARANGRHLLRLRQDWERVKYDVMRLVLACKFAPGREESSVLLATANALLVEGTEWADEVWGVNLKAGRKGRSGEQRDGEPWGPGEGWQVSPGRNWLGALLMARRAELFAEMSGARFSYAQVATFAQTLPPRAPSPKR